MSFENIIIRTLMPGNFVREIIENLGLVLAEFSAIVQALEAGKSE